MMNGWLLCCNVKYAPHKGGAISWATSSVGINSGFIRAFYHHIHTLHLDFTGIKMHPKLTIKHCSTLFFSIVYYGRIFFTIPCSPSHCPGILRENPLLSWNKLQGVPKKMKLWFCFLSLEPRDGFSNLFFPLLKT